MKVRVAPGKVLNHNSKILKEGEEVDLPDSVVNDPAVRGCIVPVEEKK